METGHIRIKDKVYFEPDGLPKPDEITLLNLIAEYEGDEYEAKIGFLKKVQEYEASKQLIEVSNVVYENVFEMWYYEPEFDWSKHGHIVKNNQPCKAEITGESATIVELTK